MTKRKIASIISILFFKLFFEFTIYTFIITQYSYYGYDVEFSLIRCIIGWGVFFLYIPICLEYINKDDFQNKVFFFLTMMYFVPGLSLYQFIKVDVYFYLLWLLFWVFFCALTKIPAKFSHCAIPIIKKGKSFFIIILAIIILLVLFVSWKYTGFRIYITFSDEYTLRTQERGFLLPSIVWYLYASAPLIIALAICILICKKKYILSGVLVFIQILNFSIGGHKAILISTLIAVGVGILNNYFNKIEKIKNEYVLYLMTGEIIFEFFMAKCLNSLFFVANFSRRVYFIPQLLNYYYYDYFTKNPYDYYAQGPGRFFGMKSLYDTNIAKLIAQNYFGTEGNYNNGLFSEAYSNLGVFGCIFVPILLMIVIYVLEQFIKEKSWGIMVFFAFSCASLWGSGNITTSLLTNGLLLVALLLLFYQDTTNKKKEYK